MSYIRAEEVLPKELLASVQQYVDGQMLYIPRKEKEKRKESMCYPVFLNYKNIEQLLCPHFDSLQYFSSQE